MKAMFGLFKKKQEPIHLSAEIAEAPANNFVTRLLAEEMPILDSASRIRVHQILKEYDGPEITCQEDLPEELKEILDLY